MTDISENDIQVVRKWLDGGCPSWGVPVDQIRKLCSALAALEAQFAEARETLAESEQKAEAENERLRKALERERRRATDAEYFNIAYRNMLGPVGRKVAEMWREKGVTRVHFAWGPDADNLTGEERAQFILDLAARRALGGKIDE